jgi:hypothetical protein
LLQVGQLTARCIEEYIGSVQLDTPLICLSMGELGAQRADGVLLGPAFALEKLGLVEQKSLLELFAEREGRQIGLEQVPTVTAPMTSCSDLAGEAK